MEQGEGLLPEMSNVGVWELKGLIFEMFWFKVGQILPCCSTVIVFLVIDLRLELSVVLS